MVSVTSIVPSGITIVSDWKFSMRRSRVIPCAAPASCRGRAEADFGRFALGGRGDLEEFARLESQHVRENIRGELLDFGVQVADHGIVIAPRVLDRVLNLSERSLQR